MAAASLISKTPLAPGLAASEPPEARGLRRDQVRLLVSDVERGTIDHARFDALPRWLAPGDLLVVNTSGTVNAAVDAVAASGERFELHLSTRLPGGFWTVEVRTPAEPASRPYRSARPGTVFELPAGASVTILAPYPYKNLANPANPANLANPANPDSRLWLATLALPEDVGPYLARHGAPIRYGYVPRRWPIAMYQTVFTTEPGSAEMPSAGRPFTPDLVTRLVAGGVEIAPLLLHTGVASLEDHEPPYEEFYRVPRETADRVTAARRRGARVIAVGTTVVRALESCTDDRGTTSPGEGWTDRVVTRTRGVRSANGMITGLHEPRATHLAMLEALAGRDHIERAYGEAIRLGYLWHEFGDSHLILATWK